MKDFVEEILKCFAGDAAAHLGTRLKKVVLFFDKMTFSAIKFRYPLSKESKF